MIYQYNEETGGQQEVRINKKKPREAHTSEFGIFHAHIHDIKREGRSYTKDEQNALAMQAKAGDQQASGELYKSVGMMAVKLTFQWWRENRGVPVLEILGAATEGYTRSLKTYEKEKGDFSGHTYTWMRSFIRACVIAHNFPNLEERIDDRTIAKHIGEIQVALQQYGTDEEGLKRVAAEYHIRDVENLKDFLRYTGQVSLQTPIAPDSDDTIEETIQLPEGHDEYERKKRDQERRFLLHIAFVEATRRIACEANGLQDKHQMVLATRGIAYGKGRETIAIVITERGIEIREGRDIPTLRSLEETIGVSYGRIDQYGEQQKKIFAETLKEMARPYGGIEAFL